MMKLSTVILPKIVLLNAIQRGPGTGASEKYNYYQPYTLNTMIYDRAGPITMIFSCIMLLIYLPKLYLLVDKSRRRGHF